MFKRLYEKGINLKLTWQYHPCPGQTTKLALTVIFRRPSLGAVFVNALNKASRLRVIARSNATKQSKYEKIKRLLHFARNDSGNPVARRLPMGNSQANFSFFVKIASDLW